MTLRAGLFVALVAVVGCGGNPPDVLQTRKASEPDAGEVLPFSGRDAGGADIEDAGADAGLVNPSSGPDAGLVLLTSNEYNYALRWEGIAVDSQFVYLLNGSEVDFIPKDGGSVSELGVASEEQGGMVRFSAADDEYVWWTHYICTNWADECWPDYRQPNDLVRMSKVDGHADVITTTASEQFALTDDYVYFVSFDLNTQWRTPGVYRQAKVGGGPELLVPGLGGDGLAVAQDEIWFGTSTTLYSARLDGSRVQEVAQLDQSCYRIGSISVTTDSVFVRCDTSNSFLDEESPIYSVPRSGGAPVLVAEPRINGKSNSELPRLIAAGDTLLFNADGDSKGQPSDAGVWAIAPPSRLLELVGPTDIRITSLAYDGSNIFYLSNNLLRISAD